MMELLRHSGKALNQAIIMVTHDPRAASYADRVIFLRDGRQVDQLELVPDEPLPQRIRQIIEKLEALEV